MLAFLAATVAATACNDATAPDIPFTSPYVELTATVSKTTLAKHDTMWLNYSVKNITATALTLTTNGGCTMLPRIGQVSGPKMSPPPLTGYIICPSITTTRTLQPNEIVTGALLLGGYDPNASTQASGYLLTSGTFDASMLLSATEVGGQVQTQSVRFTVQ